ncbi:hypothetical protein D3C80_1587060 [compost metagenome]
MVAIVFLQALLVADRELARHELDVDVVLAGEIEHVPLGVLGHVEQRLRPFVAERFLGFVGPGALAGAELAAVAPRRAVAEAAGVDERDIDAVARKVVGRLEPGIAAADDGDVRLARSRHLRVFGSIRDGCLIPGETGRDRALPGHWTAFQVRRSAAGTRVPTG